MMQTLLTYLTLGWNHIVSVDALDHQLFLLALVIPFRKGELRRVILLITAFTIGHSMTLALSSMGMVKIPASTIEFLIPLSIFITALMQLWPAEEKGKFSSFFGMTGIFGLLHGLGFANTLKSMLGQEDSVMMPLAGFNVGVEFGQLALLGLIWGVFWLFESYFPKRETTIKKILIMLVLAGSAWMMLERMPV